MRDDERAAIGLGPATAVSGFSPDPEANAIRWFWRALSLLLLAGLVFLWVRLGEVDEGITSLDEGVDSLSAETRINRAFICRVLYAEGELEPDGPCYSDEIYPLWEEYAAALDAGGG